jgi:membrane protein implicated in regulation of membrane protease activity
MELTQYIGAVLLIATWVVAGLSLFGIVPVLSDWPWEIGLIVSIILTVLSILLIWPAKKEKKETKEKEEEKIEE